MKLACHTGMWGGIVAHPAGVTSVTQLHYVAGGAERTTLQQIADAGYLGYETFDGNLHRYQDDLGELERLTEAAGLELIAVYCGGNFVYPDILGEELDRIGRTAALARDLGARFLNVGGGALRSSGIEASDIPDLGRALDRVAEIADRHGLRATYHPHGGTLCETEAQLEELAEHTTIAFCLDTAHLLDGGADPAKMIRRYRERLPYVHLKDFRDGEYVPVGEGDVSFTDVIAALLEWDTVEWWTTELDSTDRSPADVARQNREVVESFVEHAAKRSDPTERPTT